jgi:hypothetical protein
LEATVSFIVVKRVQHQQARIQEQAAQTLWPPESVDHLALLNGSRGLLSVPSVWIYQKELLSESHLRGQGYKSPVSAYGEC